ncbi:MAG: hypothetical protein A2Y33_09315 [Spirochaetes bacterium GWF1_51_8]|nr:MAG: hypothetical protein A2Y33_09315 [Spirochaetes bacterium GWF1_51_8]
MFTVLKGIWLKIAVIIGVLVPGLFAGHAFAQNITSGFGPYMTYSSKKAKSVTVAYFTGKKEKFNLKIHDGKIVFVKKENKVKFHAFPVKVEPSKNYQFTIESLIPQFHGKQSCLSMFPADKFRFAVFGDTAESLNDFSKMSETVKQFAPNFFIIPGNLTKDSYNFDEWQKFFTAGEKLFKGCVFMPVVGVKDYYGQIWEKLFDVSNKRFPFYSYELPYATVIVLNTGMYLEKDSAQYIWLVEELKTAKSKWKIVVFHHAPFSTTAKKNDKSMPQIHATLIPLLEQYKVDLVINGMDNLYERSVKNGILYITGGSVSPITDTPGSDNPYRQFEYHAKNVFTLFDVASDSITVTAHTLQNETVDTFQLKK